MIVLGINGINDIFHDASATLIKDNRIIASVEEERFNRRKHSNGLPFQAITYCLRRANVKFEDIDHIGYYLDPNTLRGTFVDDVVKHFGCRAEAIGYYARAAQTVSRVRDELAKVFPFSERTQFHYVNHHLAHASSAYYISDFDDAAILTIDGAGDRETSTLYHGKGPTLTKVHDFLVYPSSLGFIYTVLSDHLGLGWIEGPGKLMGLSGYGTPDPALFEDIIRLSDDPRHAIQIDLTYFDYHIGGKGLTAKGVDRFGPRREQIGPLLKRHFDLAATTQLVLEQAVLHLARAARQLTPDAVDLCFSGGVALNVCTNRKLLESGLFRAVFVPPPAYDGGTSLGCALHLNTQQTGQHKYDFSVYNGPDITQDYPVESTLRAFTDHLKWERMDEEALCRTAALLISRNNIVGWAQGRMECGPRALGNRSILTNATNPRAKEDLNARVKKREWFRPYAPSVLAEHCGEWFDIRESPYMLFEARVLPDKMDRIPGIVHVDGTARPQTVTVTQNPRYHKLIRMFHQLTGVPVVLNTSFNMHGEPIVNTPEEAIRDLLDSDMDALFLGDFYITKYDRERRPRAAADAFPRIDKASLAGRLLSRLARLRIFRRLARARKPENS